ncbi:MAG TPA: iron-sulfur cluster assembly protein [Flavisolibacter sp.]|jgi:FeS assembly SUF system protein|nr:iron-sulfur cluster assembly protein [Flavisolibacter sp.]
MINNNLVIEKLKTIYDPEIPVNIYDLGLIYSIDIDDNIIHVVMTLTTATCPAAAFMPEEVRMVLQEIPEAGTVTVDVVYEPRWTRDRMSEAAKQQLGFA